MSTQAVSSSCDIRLDPIAKTWDTLISKPNPSPRAARFREQLGISTTKPIVMSGHQAQFWHPGILAKLFAASALAERTGAELVWLVVDTDANDPLTIRVPARENSGPLQETLLNFIPPSKRGVKRPTGFTEAVTPTTAELADGLSPASDEIAAKLDTIYKALASHASERSAARQVTHAMFDLLADVIDTPKIVYASEIAETELFAKFTAKAADKPAELTGAFNEAVRATPGSGVAELSVSNEELPMWRIDERSRRQRATADDARNGKQLMPGGMLMTGLMRLAGCDLFIHGTGGRDYELINDRWLTTFTDEPLAPFVTATATLLLRFDGHGIVTQREAQQARWDAHRARHEPALLGEHELQATKRAMVDEISQLPRRSTERKAAYTRMQELLESMRIQHADLLGERKVAAELMQIRADEFRLRTDRTWAAALHSGERLCELGRCIADEFCG